MKVAATIYMLAVVALIPSSLVVAKTDAPRVERPVWPPPGSTWTVQTKSTGSLGFAGNGTVTFQALGEQDRDGRRVIGVPARAGLGSLFRSAVVI